MSTTVIDTAMSLVGNKNKYQLLSILFFSSLWIQLTFLLLGPAFIYMNPYFKCDFQEQYVTQEKACSRMSQCKIVNDFTITGYVQLYCDKQTQRNLIQSIFYLGAITGLIIMNIFADSKGRRLGVIISCFCATFGVALSILGGYQKSTWILSFGQYFNGFGAYSSIILSYIYIYDVCDQKNRQRAIIGMSGVIWGLFEMFFCFLFYFLNEWYNFLVLFMLIPLIGLTLISSFFIIQTPIFLYYKKRNVKQCLQALQYIALYNNKEQSMLQVQRIIQQDQQKMKTQKDSQEKTQVSIRQVLSNKQFAKSILAISIVVFTINMFYYGIQYSLEQIGTSFGLNVLFTGFVQLIGNSISITLIDKVPRRKGIFCTNLAIVVMGLLFCIPFINQNKIIGTIVLGLCRICTTFSQAIIPLLQIETFPSTVQSTGTGIIEALSQIGNFLTPFVVAFVTNAGINPVIIVSLVVLIFGLIPLKFIKETFKSTSKSQKNQIKQSLIDSINDEQGKNKKTSQSREDE